MDNSNFSWGVQVGKSTGHLFEKGQKEGTNKLSHMCWWVVFTVYALWIQYNIIVHFHFNHSCRDMTAYYAYITSRFS